MAMLKEKLISAPLLTCPDFSKPFFLQTDASCSGLGAVLFQKGDEAEEHPIAFASRSLTTCEKKYSTTELECLAVLWAVDKFRAYLEGLEFTVITDHAALKWLNNLKDPHGRLARWALKLQEYPLTIVHRPGKQNVVADALSRAFEVEALQISYDVLDPWYLKMLMNVKKKAGDYPKWRVEGSKLWKHIPDKRKILGEDNPWKLVIPKSQRKEILFNNHDSEISGHLGTFKTLQRLREYYYWPGMAADTARYVARCETCMAHKPSQQGPQGLMGEQRVVSRPWQIVSADLMGPLPLSSNQNRFIIAISDYFTKYVVAVPLRQASAKKVVEVLEKEVFLRFGVPQVLICDNGTQFKGRELNALTTEYGVRIQFTPYYHPQSNPQERSNRVIKTLIASYVKENHRHWDKCLPKICFAINTSVHEATGYSPAYLNFGRELPRSASEHPDIGVNNVVPNCQDRKSYIDKFSNLPVLHEEVKDRLQRAYERSRQHYNLRRRDLAFDEGDIVWRRTHHQSDAANYFAGKLAPKFSRSRVVRKISNLMYDLEDMDGSAIGVWHIQDLKPEPPDETNIDSEED